MDAQGVAMVITACAGLIIAMGTCTATILAALHSTNKRIDAVKAEVVTGNEQTMGQLTGRVETRRVEEIPVEERTAKEQRHVDADPEHLKGGSL